MAIPSFFVVILIALIFAVSGVFFIRNIHQKAHKNREQKKLLLQRIESLRLPKMLQALGIGFANYYYKVPFNDIDKCVSECEQCTETNLCDEKLKIPELNPSDIDFCPNQQHLSRFSRANRIKG